MGKKGTAKSLTEQEKNQQGILVTMLNPIRKIVIVGGGAAGWMCAAFLNKLRRDKQPFLEITVVDPPTGSAIGVGEATTTTTHDILWWLGVDENDWLKKCDGSFKLGILFTDWYQKNEGYWHLFENPERHKNVALPLLWLSQFPSRDYRQFAYDCFSAPTVCEAFLAPRMHGALPYGSDLTYGYHVSVAKHIAYLKMLSLEHVRLVSDEIAQINLDEKGFIKDIQTQTGESLTADLFIDCTGFKGLLINKTMGEPFVSFADSLLCDRAIAVQLPHRVPQAPIRPYTTAAAMNHGWCWDIPLQSRDGAGYVHCGAFVSVDEAMKEFSEKLKTNLVNLDPKVIHMRTGYTKKPWVKNCVSIGLANGFIEPLESTGNSLIEFACMTLYKVLKQFRGRSIPEDAISKSNTRVRRVYEEVRDFVVLHYALTKRDDTAFWRAIQHDMRVPEVVREKLAYFESGMPNRDISSLGLPWFDDFFPQFSYLCILVGMNCLPKVRLESSKCITSNDLENAFSDNRKRAQILLQKLPPLRDFLNQLEPDQNKNATALRKILNVVRQKSFAHVLPWTY